MAVGVAGPALAAVAVATVAIALAAAALATRPHRGGDTVTGTDPDWGTGPYSFVAAVAAQYATGHRPRLGNRRRSSPSSAPPPSPSPPPLRHPPPPPPPAATL